MTLNPGLIPSERLLLPAPARHLADANTYIRHVAENGAWIWHPKRGPRETAVVRFTLRFELPPGVSPLIHVSGDQRFQLRCDGRDLTFGPDRCDVEHWTVQSLRLSLAPGVHELEAIAWWIAEPENLSQRVDQEVVSDAIKPPMAQMAWKPGFLLYAEDVPEEVLNTGVAPWQVADLTSAVRMFAVHVPHYYDVGPGFDIDLDAWRDAESVKAHVVEPPLAENVYGVRRPGWCLYPATLPEQAREEWRGGKLRAFREGHSDVAFAEADERVDENGMRGLAALRLRSRPVVR